MRQAILFAVALLLAGCTGNAPESTPTPDADPSNGPTAPDEDPAPENRAPAITLTATILNGTAPVNTTVTVVGDDEDGDALSWSIDVGGDGVDAEGQGTRGTHELTLAEAGTYLVQASVSDAVLTSSASIQITVLAPAPQTQTVEGETVGQSTACTEDAEWSSGDGYAEILVVPGTIGHGFYVEFTENSAFHRVVFADAEGTVIESHMLGLGVGVEPGDVDDGDWEMYGTVPGSSATLVLISCGNILDPVDGLNPFLYEAGPDVGP